MTQNAGNCGYVVGVSNRNSAIRVVGLFGQVNTIPGGVIMLLVWADQESNRTPSESGLQEGMAAVNYKADQASWSWQGGGDQKVTWPFCHIILTRSYSESFKLLREVDPKVKTTKAVKQSALRKVRSGLRGSLLPGLHKYCVFVSASSHPRLVHGSRSQRPPECL